MSDIKNISGPPQINTIREGVGKGDSDDLAPQYQKREDQKEHHPEHSFVPDDDLRISLDAIEEKIIHDVRTLLGFYDDIPDTILDGELEEEEKETSKTTGDPAYRQAASVYQKNQESLYQKRPFPFPGDITLDDEDTEIFELLNFYWDQLEDLRSRHLEDIPHKHGQDLYVSLNSFLDTYFS